VGPGGRRVVTSNHLHTLHVQGGLHAALTAGALTGVKEDDLRRFLAGKRWFGAKGRTPTRIHIAEVAPLPLDDIQAAVACVDVQLGERIEHYQVPLIVRESGAEKSAVIDATEDQRFRESLGRALATGSSLGGATTPRWMLEPISRLPTPGSPLPARLGSAEQSNTSIIYGDAAMLKLFRRLEPGEHPDVEITRALTTRTSFRNTPRLLGVVRYESADGWSAVAGMLQEYLPGSIDGWSYALDRGRSYFRAPRTAQPRNEFAPDAERLGRITRELHEALASRRDDPDFAPLTVTRADVQRWAESTRRTVQDALTRLEERVPALPPARAAEARVVVRRAPEYLADASRIAGEIGEDAGERIRHHGDYHLGQVLRTTTGDFMVIDFEGEPARPLAERRERHSALRDVAGMLRSLAYAAATLATEQAGSLDIATLETRSARWERDTRDAFLRGYASKDAGGARFLPGSQNGVARLLSLFEMEKVFYELSYELNNRPDWVWIPLRGIARLTTARRTVS
ncbi:MAG: maltokinase N-terminal cap-like domain-containing protein, partial [Gemmatimonadaceae bacterium]